MKIETQDSLSYYVDSKVEHEGTTYQFARDKFGAPYLAVQGDTTGFVDQAEVGDGQLYLPTPANAVVLRQRLPWLSPVPLKLALSAGFGDRLGLATPGHVEAVRGTGIAPIFAQQSVRENVRTHRSPQEVVDDAMWGAFQAGWREAWGADADHLKVPADIQPFVDAGYSFFTIDPGDHVDNTAEVAEMGELTDKTSLLDWNHLESSVDDLRQQFLDRTFELDGLTLTFDEETLYKAAVKYGPAVVHARIMHDHIKSAMGNRPFDLEVSVDETETPTTPHEHFYIASELKRLGIEWVSMAPRFVGKFEKGVDYIGDLGYFESEMEKHAAVMRHFGGYKISLHSGSDKFSIYAIAVRHASGLVHLKTAGTSYLEALRVIAVVDPPFFRDVLDLAHQRFGIDRATYHISAMLEKVPTSDQLSDADLPDLLNQFDARQVLHVTFGSILDKFGDNLQTVLKANEAAYTEGIERHFERHLTPLQPTA
jgi:hypothetical protein